MNLFIVWGLLFGVCLGLGLGVGSQLGDGIWNLALGI